MRNRSLIPIFSAALLAASAGALIGAAESNRVESNQGDRESSSFAAPPTKLTPRLFVGGEPVGERAFAELTKLGVRTVVSVDGARPKVELAAKHRLKYVHIPFGYDGVPRDAMLALTRVAREAPGAVYVHCHHGTRRGPAAAAIVARAMGVANSNAEGRRLLATAGADTRFIALQQDALAYRPPPPSVELPPLVAVAEVDPFMAAMAAVGRAWEKLDDKASRHRENAALLLYEALRESKRAAIARREADARLLTWLDEAQGAAQQLTATDAATFSKTYAALGQQCQRCHTEYRDKL